MGGTGDNGAMGVTDSEAADQPLDPWVWDEQIADDLDTGRLDALLAEVDQEYEAGLARPLWRGTGARSPQVVAVRRHRVGQHYDC